MRHDFPGGDGGVGARLGCQAGFLASMGSPIDPQSLGDVRINGDCNIWKFVKNLFIACNKRDIQILS